jgi:hypothetical protein
MLELQGAVVHVGLGAGRLKEIDLTQGRISEEE